MYDMHGAWGFGGGMNSLMSLTWLLLAVALILVIAALVKYLFFSGPRK